MSRKIIQLSFNYGKDFENIQKLLGSEFNVELQKAEYDISKRVLKTAKEEHRYKHRTHKLRNSTKIDGRLDSKAGMRLYVDDAECDYGKYVIRGHGSWAGDPFIDEAIKINRDYIKKRIQQAIDNTIIKLNRRK